MMLIAMVAECGRERTDQSNSAVLYVDLFANIPRAPNTAYGGR
jgi:hypothetical protein